MRPILIVAFAAFALASCTRNAANTSKQITILGSVRDSSNRVVMPNILVRVSWFNEASQETPVDSVRTDAQGNFSFKTMIDLARFNTQTLEVAAVVPNNYISVFDMDHPTVGASFKGFGNLDSWQLAPFEMYEKANLTINLQQTINDNFTEFQLSYNHGNRDYWVNATNTRPSGNVSYNVVTAAGVKTRVSWKKKFSTGATTSFQDSTNIRANTANMITVPY